MFTLFVAAFLSGILTLAWSQNTETRSARIKYLFLADKCPENCAKPPEVVSKTPRFSKITLKLARPSIVKKQ